MSRPTMEDMQLDALDGILGHLQARPTVSLRDYFAAACLQSIVRSQDNRFMPGDDAAWCYKVADAMLKARDG